MDDNTIEFNERRRFRRRCYYNINNDDCREGNILILILCIALPLLIGFIASSLTKNARITFVRIAKPPLTLPASVFPIVWAILLVLMGIASYMIWRSKHSDRNVTLIIYAIQLVFYFAWNIFFFRNGTYWFAAAWLFLLWLMILALIALSSNISKCATWLLVPYCIWCTYALYLNIGIAILNR